MLQTVSNSLVKAESTAALGPNAFMGIGFVSGAALSAGLGLCVGLTTGRWLDAAGLSGVTFPAVLAFGGVGHVIDMVREGPSKSPPTPGGQQRWGV